MFAKFSKAAVAAAAAAAVLAPVGAQAQTSSYQGYGQSYDYYGRNYGPSYDRQPYYDPCVRDQRERQTAGGLVGGALGAVVGSQVSARGRRTEGSVLGGVLGAVVGSSVGRSQAACDSGYGYDRGYTSSAPVYDDRYYGQDQYDRRSYDDDRRDYDRRDYDSRYDYSRPSAGYGQRDECRLAESRIRLPDGREEVRYVRTCPDAYGRYRVVD